MKGKHDVSNGINKKVKILMISSCGGHWVQMNRLVPIFKDEALHFASTEASYSSVNPDYPFHFVPEASRTSSMFTIMKQALSVLKIVWRIRPNIVITTGASTGFFALFFAKKLGAKTIWLDSIANVDSVSMSGEKSAKYADLYITQWEELARDNGPHYFGSVI